ncbi:hypothetical protein CYMTET_38832 [Cymbomonas tetramitiformis]|uniref:Ubiquitin-like protease family profile domain-containing protein n=1 Tax=Cymbomonas tetramitiformis TaxID=36881 RepID=A0AAE0CCF6_9CHLO|nr:hypothetical protein CYMTET_38832 [Cymbomonas tetramitiformis]KAK3251839.1 hypothetical protein CYMTET_38832 [Cymbomonas tetramitiformis]
MNQMILAWHRKVSGAAISPTTPESSLPHRSSDDAAKNENALSDNVCLRGSVRDLWLTDVHMFNGAQTFLAKLDMCPTFIPDGGDMKVYPMPLEWFVDLLEKLEKRKLRSGELKGAFDGKRSPTYSFTDGTHWRCVFIDGVHQKKIYTFDSLGEPNFPREVTTYLQRAFPGWSCESIAGRFQSDAHSCGLWVLAFQRQWLQYLVQTPAPQDSFKDFIGGWLQKEELDHEGEEPEFVAHPFGPPKEDCAPKQATTAAESETRAPASDAEDGPIRGASSQTPTSSGANTTEDDPMRGTSSQPPPGTRAGTSDPEPTDTDSRQNSGSNCETSGSSDLLQRLTRERDAKIDSIKKEIKDLEEEMAAEDFDSDLKDEYEEKLQELNRVLVPIHAFGSAIPNPGASEAPIRDPNIVTLSADAIRKLFKKGFLWKISGDGRVSGKVQLPVTQVCLQLLKQKGQWALMTMALWMGKDDAANWDEHAYQLDSSVLKQINRFAKEQNGVLTIDVPGLGRIDTEHTFVTCGDYPVLCVLSGEKDLGVKSEKDNVFNDETKEERRKPLALFDLDTRKWKELHNGFWLCTEYDSGCTAGCNGGKCRACQHKENIKQGKHGGRCVDLGKTDTIRTLSNRFGPCFPKTLQVLNGLEQYDIDKPLQDLPADWTAKSSLRGGNSPPPRQLVVVRNNIFGRSGMYPEKLTPGGVETMAICILHEPKCIVKKFIKKLYQRCVDDKLEGAFFDFFERIDVKITACDKEKTKNNYKKLVCRWDYDMRQMH